MNEERRAGDLSDATASSFKMGLMVAAVASGVALLLCSGVAAYVAWTSVPATDGETALFKSASLEERAKDSQRILGVARQIVTIEIPAGFEPLSGGSFPMGRQAVFGRRSDEGALLKLYRMDLPTPPRGAPQMPDQMLMQMTERGGELTSSNFAEVDEGSVSDRELTVLGNRETFHILSGKRTSGGKTLRKVGGAFTLGNSRIALIYTIPEEEFDEEAVVRMIESIRAPEGEGVNRSDPSTDSGSTTHSPVEDSEKGEPRQFEDRSSDDEAPPGESEAPGTTNED